MTSKNKDVVEEENQELTDKDLIIAAVSDNKNKIRFAIENMEDTVKAFKKEFGSVIEALTLALKKNEKAVVEAQSNNEEVNDTLRNVLLAISQNEYLQAYYPEQGEFPAGKVVGRHPKVQKRIGKDKKRCKV